MFRLASSSLRARQLFTVTKRFASTEAAQANPTKTNPIFFAEKKRDHMQNLGMLAVFGGLTAYCFLNSNLQLADVAIVKKPYSD